MNSCTYECECVLLWTNQIPMLMSTPMMGRCEAAKNRNTHNKKKIASNQSMHAYNILPTVGHTIFFAQQTVRIAVHTFGLIQ